MVQWKNLVCFSVFFPSGLEHFPSCLSSRQSECLNILLNPIQMMPEEKVTMSKKVTCSKVWQELFRLFYWPGKILLFRNSLDEERRLISVLLNGRFGAYHIFIMVYLKPNSGNLSCTTNFSNLHSFNWTDLAHFVFPFPSTWWRRNSFFQTCLYACAHVHIRYVCSLKPKENFLEKIMCSEMGRQKRTIPEAQLFYWFFLLLNLFWQLLNIISSASHI